MYLDLPRVRLHYRLEGPPDAPVVVLSSSLGTDLGMWDGVAQVLAGSLRVLRYDTRGHGGSATPPGPWSIADLAGDVVALLDALEIPTASFCGLSLGGMTGMWLATHHPQRLERLVLCCTSAQLGPAQAWRDRAAAVRAGGMRAVAEPVVARWFTEGFPAAHRGELDRVRVMLLSSDPEGYARCCEAIAEMDQRADLASVAAPTLVLGGLEDQATPPEHSRLIAQAVPGARLVLLPGAAHLAVVERPGVAARVVATHLGVGGDPAQAGLQMRRAVLGAEYVEAALAQAGPLAEFQEFVTEHAWAAVWTRPGLDLPTRSRLTLALLVARGMWAELELHLRAALRLGLTEDDLLEVLLHAAVYCGMPAANHAVAVARRVLVEAGTL